MVEKKSAKEEREREGTVEQDGKQTLPYCTTAPSPEHARAENEDEPCDDSRGSQEEEQGGQ